MRSILFCAALAWHPVHESLFASGGSDGSLMFWIVGSVSVCLLSVHLLQYAYHWLSGGSGDQCVCVTRMYFELLEETCMFYG